MTVDQGPMTNGQGTMSDRQGTIDDECWPQGHYLWTVCDPWQLTEAICLWLFMDSGVVT